MLYEQFVEGMKANLEADKEKINNALADLTKKEDLINGLVSAVAADIKAEKEASFNEGLAQAGQLGGEGKIYSDAELEAELAPLKAAIAEKDAKIVELEAKLAEAPKMEDIQAKIDEAVAIKAVEIKNLMSEAKAKEDEIEAAAIEAIK